MTTLPAGVVPVALERRDAEALWALDRLCFPGDVAFSLGTFRQLLRDRRHLGFRLGGRAGPAATTVASAAAAAPTPVAFVMALREAVSADIVTLDVHPEHRRRGLGRALLRHLHATLRRTGAQEVTLQVAEDNTGARQLYLSEGYAAVGVARGYYGDRGDAVLMRLALREPPGAPAAAVGER